MNAITVHESPAMQQFQAAKGSLMVHGLRPGLPERGKIKIGMKGAQRRKKGATGDGDDAFYQMPKKLDHFIVTTVTRDEDGNFVRDQAIMDRIAKSTKQNDGLYRLPIRLLFDDIELNFQTRYARFKGRSLACSGNGVEAMEGDKKRKCTCEQIKPGGSCKINGRLQVVLDGADTVGGVWIFRTTSWNTVTGIYSALALIQAASGGKLAGLDLDMTIGPKTVSTPDGKQMTAYIVGIEYRGNIDQLREESVKAYLEEATHRERIAHVQEQAKVLISAPVVGGDEDEDIADEFYPDSVNDSAAVQSEVVEKHDLAAELAEQTRSSDVEADAPHFDIDAFARKLGADLQAVVTPQRAVELRMKCAPEIEQFVRPISHDRADKMLAALDAKCSEMDDESRGEAA